MGPGGLLGIVYSTTPTTARVKLLTSPRSQIGVWVPRTRRHGILKGMGTSRPKLVFLDNDAQVKNYNDNSTKYLVFLIPPKVEMIT